VVKLSIRVRILLGLSHVWRLPRPIFVLVGGRCEGLCVTTSVIQTSRSQFLETYVDRVLGEPRVVSSTVLWDFLLRPQYSREK
jgi:hypothetical protein